MCRKADLTGGHHVHHERARGRGRRKLLDGPIGKVDKRVLVFLDLVTMRNAQYDGPSGVADVLRELSRFGKHALQEAVRLHLLDGMVRIHRCTAANHTCKVLSVFTETVAIGKENEGVLPADKLATHRKDRAIRVDGALFVEHVDRDVGIVQHKDVLAEHLDMGDVA